MSPQRSVQAARRPTGEGTRHRPSLAGDRILAGPRAPNFPLGATPAHDVPHGDHGRRPGQDLPKHEGRGPRPRRGELEVPEGTVLGLLGPNGAGKTTTVRILATLVRPTRGARPCPGTTSGRRRTIRRGIGLSGQNAAVDENLTGRENLRLFGRLYHLTSTEARKRSDQLLEQFELTDAGDRVVKTYSGGMRRRLDLGARPDGRPRVLFLDEPTTGLDPRAGPGCGRCSVASSAKARRSC